MLIDDYQVNITTTRLARAADGYAKMKLQSEMKLAVALTRAL